MLYFFSLASSSAFSRTMDGRIARPLFLFLVIHANRPVSYSGHAAFFPRHLLQVLLTFSPQPDIAFTDTKFALCSMIFFYSLTILHKGGALMRESPGVNSHKFMKTTIDVIFLGSDIGSMQREGSGPLSAFWTVNWNQFAKTRFARREPKSMNLLFQIFSCNFSVTRASTG